MQIVRFESGFKYCMCSTFLDIEFFNVNRCDGWPLDSGYGRMETSGNDQMEVQIAAIPRRKVPDDPTNNATITL